MVATQKSSAIGAQVGDVGPPLPLSLTSFGDTVGPSNATLKPKRCSLDLKSLGLVCLGPDCEYAKSCARRRTCC